MAPDTRAAIREKGLSLWLKADLDTLYERVARRSNRPLLKTADPKETLRGLMAVRYPVYAEADIVVERSEEHTSELQSLMRISYAVFCLKKTNTRSLDQTCKTHSDERTRHSATYIQQTASMNTSTISTK